MYPKETMNEEISLNNKPNYAAAQGVKQLAEPEPDSLATVAPRVINLAIKMDQMTDHLEHSLGISPPLPPQTADAKSPQPTLMNQLQMVEQLLENAGYALDNINRHVNG